MQFRNSWFLVLVVVLTGLSLWSYSATKYSYGLDVSGGMRILYRIDTSKLSAEKVKGLAVEQNKVRSILDRRVKSGLGVVEGEVVTKGEDEIIVELPGATNEKQAKAVLSNTAKIQLYHAKNVSTEKRSKRYMESLQETDPTGAPYYTFSRAADPSKVFKPGDPEYKAMIDGWDLILEGEDVVDARGKIVNGNKAQPEFVFQGQGANRLEAWSKKYLNEGEKIAFVLDGTVLDIKSKANGAVLKESAYVQGEFDPEYVRQLTSMIKNGSLNVDLIEESFESVDPTIGTKALDQIVLGSAISLGVICIYLIAYYAFPGIIATVALALYTLFTLTLLKLMGATFSLAAIAAFILSVGMAVDANILVFERVKEELRSGRKLLSAIELGFKRALTAIIDSNICTILTSLVLFMLGTGPVKGFATALIVGVLVSFFTAVTVTRSLLVGLVSVGIGANEKWYALNRNLFGEKLEASADDKRIHIIRRMKTFFILSAALIVPGIVFVGLGGIKPNVEFQGGYEAQFKVPDSVSPEQIRKGLEAGGFKGFNERFATVQGTKVVYLTLPPSDALTGDGETSKKKVADAAGLTTEGSSWKSVGPRVQKETTSNAILGVLISSGLIVLYLAVRFGFALGGMKNGLKFGLSAVLAMLHDVAFVIGAAGIVGFFLGWEVSALFITAILTVIGFSVHDTIIIFDRIRENLRRSKTGETFEELVDKSVTQTIARSINTSAAAMFPLAVLLFIGTPTPELKFMVLTMLLGIAIGTYSSIFNASPILYLWDKAVIKSKGEGAGLHSEALRESKLRAAQVLANAPGTGKATDTSQYGTIKRRKSADTAAQVIDEE